MSATLRRAYPTRLLQHLYLGVSSIGFPAPMSTSGSGPAVPQSAAAAPPGGSASAGSAKRQRLLAPLPTGSGPQAAGDGGSKPLPRQRGRVAASYKEPGPGVHQLGGGATLLYRTDLLRPAEAAAMFDQLRRELPWEQRSVRVMGREVQQPRLIAYQADGPELSYTYSGATLAPAPWHPVVAALKMRAEAGAGPGVEFNCCLLNLYRSGADSIAWHSDSEPLFGRQPTIASLSLGSPREFLLRENADHSNKYRFRLGGGALLVMSGRVQEAWMHSVPRRAAAPGERISLTFRRILRPERGAPGRGAS